MDLTQRGILSRHCLFQTSWTGDKRCQHVKGMPSRRSTPSISEYMKFSYPIKLSESRPPSSRSNSTVRTVFNGISNGQQVSGQTKDESSDYKWTKSDQQPLLVNYGTPHTTDPVPHKTAFQKLEDRRNYRSTRRKPWNEKAVISRPNKKYEIEYVYESNLPDNLDNVNIKLQTRKYVTNSKYGNLYEIRHEIEPEPPEPETHTWMWEDKFYLWLYDKYKERNQLPSTQKTGWKSNTDRTAPLHSTRTPRTERNSRALPKGSYEWNTLQRPRSESPRRLKPSPRSKQGNKEKPHADLFAHYNSYRLEKQRQTDASIMLQKMFRGWRVRNHINKLKRKARLEHGCSWFKFITEYKELVTRIQSRYGEMRTSCGLDLKQLEAYMDQKYKNERAFETIAYGDKLLKSDLGEFFKGCGMHPAEREISDAFNSVFKGSGNTGELVFLLDCSSSVGKYNFLYLTSFVKDIISNFEIGPDRVRVGVIPFTDDIEHAFGITTYRTKQETLNAIDSMQPREGLTRTDLALKLMTSMLNASRPGVRKLGIVITDGKSSEPDLTQIAAKKAHDQSIEIFAIGVGKHVDEEELNIIATSEKHVLHAHDYMSLRSLKEDITKSTCLDACVLCQSILPRIRNCGLYKNEAMEIVWSLYTPPGCRIVYGGNLSDESSKEQSRLKGNGKTKCRPLTKPETMEIFWTIYPPSASNISKKSRWIRPIIEDTEAWTLLDKNIVNSTDIKTCLRLVIQSKIEREGHVMLPANVRDGVQKVSNPDEAVMIVEEWLKEKREKEVQNRENLLART